MKTTAAILLALAAAQAQTPAYRDPGIGRIAQIAIVCKDIDKCAERWSRLLGQPAPKPRTTLPGNEVQLIYRGKPSNAQVKLTFFKTGDATLELMQPLGPGTHWQEHLDQYGEGVHHIAFQVKDLDKTIAALEADGMPVIHRGRYDGKNGDYVYVDSRDKLGVTIELLHSDEPKK